MSSSSTGSLDSASSEPLDLPLGGRDNNSRVGTGKEYHALELFDSKVNQTQFSSTASDRPDGAEATTKPSMATRLGASASGLMRDVLGSSSANGILSGFAAGTIDGNKGQSSPSTSGPSESSTAAQNINNRPDAGLGSSQVPIQPESFRSISTATRRTDKGAQYEFDEFMLNRHGPLLADDAREENHNGHSNSHTDHARISGSASNAMTEDDQIPTMGTQSATDASHEEDGAAVVSLLNDPEFSIDDPLAYHDIYGYKSAATDPFLPPITSQQLDLYTKIKAQLPQPPIHRAPAPTNPLNLLPNFDQLSSNTNGRSGNSATTTLHVGESYTYLTPDTTNTSSQGEASSGQSSEGTKAHLLQWLDVLNRYQDDVWGDMLPLVQDARKEIEQTKYNNSDEVHEGPAIRRLAMVFAHLKASPASVKASPLP